MEENITEIKESGIKELKIKDVIASEVIENHMLDYGRDLISRQYPHVIDGLKKVQRRIIWVVNSNGTETGLGSLIGKTEDIHTSGDSSIYKALVRLGQDFLVDNILVDILGSKGDYPDENAAPPRYLACKPSEFAMDLFFNRCIIQTLPTEYTKDFKDKEPKYFIPCVPSALFLNHSTIGIGYNSISPQLNLSNVCDLVMKTVECKTKTMRPRLTYPEAASYLIPDFPIPNYLMNRQELFEEYCKGNYKTPIHLSGQLVIKDNSVIVRYLGFGNSFLNKYENLTEKLKTLKNKFWLYDLCKQYENRSSEEPKLIIAFKNNVNVFSILDRLKKTLSLENTIHPNYHYNKNNNLLNITPIELLDMWYRERSKSILSSIKYRHSELTLQKIAEQARLIVCENTDEVISIIRGSINEEEAIKILLQKFTKLTQHQAKILNLMPIGKLTKSSKAEIEQKIEKIEIAISDVLDRYTRIDETIYNDAAYIKKKYGKPRKTTFIEDQIGCVCIGNNGVIQFNSMDEMFAILENNSRKQVKIKTYHSYYKNRQAIYNTKILNFKYKNIPKEFEGSDIIEYPNNPHTFVLKDECVSIIDGIKTPKENDASKILYIPRNFYGIYTTGRIEKMSVSDLSGRKTISKGAKSNLIHVIPTSCKDFVIIHMHSMDLNNLRMDRIIVNGDTITGKCNILPAIGYHILDVCDTASEFIALNIPASCIQKCSIEHLVIENIRNLFTTNQNINISLTCKRNNLYSLKKNKDINKLMILKTKDTSEDDE